MVIIAIHIIIDPMQTDRVIHNPVAGAAARWVAAAKREQINVHHSRSLSAVV